jgi:hypothetical protein
MPNTKKKTIRPKNKAAFKGRGDYSADILSIEKPLPRLEAKLDHLEKTLSQTNNKTSSLSSTLGRSLGALVGQSDLGGSLGDLAGKGLSKWFGKGDYNIKSNSLIHGDMRQMQTAKFSSSGKRGTRIIEREFIGNVTASSVTGQFANNVYPINPLSRVTFPWLSGIATQYDQWEPDGIIFEYISTSSEFNGSSQALGAIIAATDYNSEDSIYTTKQQMENSDYACSTKTSSNLQHGIECDPSERPTLVLYTSSTVVNSSSLGNFQIASEGCSTASVKLGELWVTYDITFYKKQLSNPMSDSYFFHGFSPSVTVGTGYLTNMVIQGQNGGFTLFQIIGTGSRILFPPFASTGQYIVSLVANNSSATNMVPSVSSGCTATGSFTSVTGASCTYTAAFTLNSVGAYIQWGLLVGTDSNSVNLFVSEVNPRQFT